MLSPNNPPTAKLTRQSNIAFNLALLKDSVTTPISDTRLIKITLPIAHAQTLTI
jgi:hypothetical protein